jgi:hypothetical protein
MSSKHCGPVIPNSSESSDTDEIELFSDPPRSAQVQVKATRTSSTKSNPTASRISKNVRDADSRSGVSGSSTQHNKAVISNRKPLGPSTAHNRGESANQSSKAVESVCVSISHVGQAQSHTDFYIGTASIAAGDRILASGDIKSQGTA